MKNREGVISSPEADPTDQEWQMLRNKIAELNTRFDDFKKMAMTAGKETPTNQHFVDLGNGLRAIATLTRPDLVTPDNASGNFELGQQQCLLLEKYFVLLDSDDEFRDKELKEGGAYPELRREFFDKQSQHHTEYKQVQDYYIEEAAKRLASKAEK